MRKRLSKSRSNRVFRRGYQNVKKVNVKTPVMRGGIRL